MPAILRLFFSSFLKALPHAFLGNLLFIVILVAAFFLHEEADDEDRRWLWLVLLALLAYPALMSAALVRIQAYADQRVIGFTEPLHRAAACFVPCIIATVLYSIAVGAGFLLLILPGMFLTIKLAFWWPALVLDRHPPVASLKTSSHLLKANWWRTAAGLTIIFSMYSVSVAIEKQTDAWPDELWLDILEAAIAWFTATSLSMLTCCAAVITYHDLKLREALRAPA